MLACILSDSLGFRSPTTTELDKTMAAELAEIAGTSGQSVGWEISSRSTHCARARLTRRIAFPAAAGLDMIDMTEKMLAAKSNVSAVDDSTLVLLDSKQYNFGLGCVRDLLSLSPALKSNRWSYLVLLPSDAHCCLAPPVFPSHR